MKKLIRILPAALALMAAPALAQDAEVAPMVYKGDVAWLMTATLLVVFMASVWPTLANTAFGVANIKKDYLNVSNILQMSLPSKIFKVLLPAAGPTIVAGLKISIGSAWVAIVPAEALLGSLGLGYFVWNEWNNLSLTSVIFAILVIGMVGVFLDVLFSQLAKRLAYTD